jgi:dihydrodipicolinate reductase
MFEYLDKLRKKEEKTRHRIALSVAFVFSFILFVVWLTVFLPNFEKENQIERLEQSRFKSPVTNFVDALSGSVMKVQESISNAKNMLNGLATSTAYYRASSTNSSENLEIKQ